ncbi:MAG: addiction module protein [Wenzhouxiangellaceae bacterium]
MTASFKELDDQVRPLAAEDRARLAETLAEPSPTPLAAIETAWAREFEERVAAFDAGGTKTYAAEDVFAAARHVNRRPSI